jgi:hypothetical protein
MITTNLGFADWTQVFGDPVMTAALLDRLTHKAHIINCTWESYRLKQSLKKKAAREKLKDIPAAEIPVALRAPSISVAEHK